MYTVGIALQALGLCAFAYGVLEWWLWWRLTGERMTPADTGGRYFVTWIGGSALVASVPLWAAGVHYAETPSFAALAALDMVVMTAGISSGVLAEAAAGKPLSKVDKIVAVALYVVLGPFLTYVILRQGALLGNPVLW